MSDGRGQDGGGRGASGARFGELELDIGGLARKCGVEQGIECQRRRIGDDRHDVVELHTITAAGIEREFCDLAARRKPVATEKRKEGCARLRRYGEACLAQLGVDQPGERLLVVLIAWERRGVLGAL